MSDIDQPAIDQSTVADDDNGESKQPVFARYGSEEVIETGNLIVQMDQKFTLYPFSDDRSYGVSIRVIVDNSINGSSSRTYMGDGMVEVEIKRQFLNGAQSGHFNLSFAQSEKYTYYLYLIVGFVGPESRYICSVVYNVARRLKS